MKSFAGFYIYKIKGVILAGVPAAAAQHILQSVPDIGLRQGSHGPLFTGSGIYTHNFSAVFNGNIQGIIHYCSAENPGIAYAVKFPETAGGGIQKGKYFMRVLEIIFKLIVIIIFLSCKPASVIRTPQQKGVLGAACHMPGNVISKIQGANCFCLQGGQIQIHQIFLRKRGIAPGI